ncbi:MAG: V-type ATP synthase subunit F [Halobacteria archaeon]
MKIAVIGDPSFTTGFRLAGVDTFSEIKEDDKEQELDGAIEDTLDDDDVGIVIMHENDLDYLSRDVRKDVEESIEPTVVMLGGEGGGGQLREKIKRAIGIDLME